jgi:hypothetical protein
MLSKFTSSLLNDEEGLRSIVGCLRTLPFTIFLATTRWNHE